MGLKWVNGSKKQCKSLFWRARAAVKKAVKNSGGKNNVKFQYDPSSYALNFDDGCCHLGAGRYEVKRAKDVVDVDMDMDTTNKKTFWVYVVWVESESQCLSKVEGGTGSFV
ncbi:hypothetical protein M5689_008753 [Euphorbia peplus]|nr:hypothetical protein M5689_008753 [Euphorbia peplus]